MSKMVFSDTKEKEICELVNENQRWSEKGLVNSIVKILNKRLKLWKDKNTNLL